MYSGLFLEQKKENGGDEMRIIVARSTASSSLFNSRTFLLAAGARQHAFCSPTPLFLLRTAKTKEASQSLGFYPSSTGKTTNITTCYTPANYVPTSTPPIPLASRDCVSASSGNFKLLPCNAGLSIMLLHIFLALSIKNRL